MSYAGTVSFISFESEGIQGTAPLVGVNVEATRQISPQGDLEWREAVNDTVTVPLAIDGTPFNFPSGRSAPLAPPSYVGLRFGRTGAPGPVFRSGYRDSLPVASSPGDSSAHVDIIETPWHMVTRLEIADAFVNAFPMTGDGITMDAGQALVDEGYIRVTVNGSTNYGPFGLVTFRFQIDLLLKPETTMSTDVPQNLFVVTTRNESLELTGSGPSVPETSAILVLVRPVVLPMVVARINRTAARAVTAAVYQEVGRLTTQTNGVGTVPDSVVLTVERVIIGTFTPGPNRPAAFGVHVLATVGTFGSVVNTLYPAGLPGTGSGRGCAGLALAPLALVVAFVLVLLATG